LNLYQVRETDDFKPLLSQMQLLLLQLGISQQPSDAELRLKMGLPESRKRGSKVVQVCGGRAHTVILTDVGRVYACGQSNRGGAVKVESS
jgi:alpha-tubulin suppressor-like RCC1 family protein